MANNKTFESLEVWQMAREQAIEIYSLTLSPRFDLRFASQVNASSGSVMDNIAEGFNRHSNREFVQFLVVARGSNGEVRSQLLRMSDQKLLTDRELQNNLKNNEVLGRKLTSLIKHLRNAKPLQQ